MTTPDDLENMLTTAQLAAAAGLSENTIRVYVNRAILHPVKVGRDLFFPPSELDTLKARKGRAGRPKRATPDTCTHEWERKEPGKMICVRCGMFGPTGEK